MLFILLSLCTGVAAIIPASQYPNIIVIPDMHGDSEALLLSLYSGYLDIHTGRRESPVAYAEFQARFQQVIHTQTRHPSGPLVTSNDVAVVQLGDLVDRGKYSLQCLLIMRAVTTVTGFKVFQVLGNHELAPIISVGSLYGPNRNPKDDLDWRSDKISRPTGILYNEVLARFDPIVRLDGGPNVDASTLFVHAGIPLSYIYSLIPSVPASANELVGSINKAIKWDLFSQKSNAELLSKHLAAETIFMTRRYLNPSACDEIGRVLELFQVSRIIVGHMADIYDNSVRSVSCPGMMNHHPVVILADMAASRYMYGFETDDNPPAPGSVVIKLNPTTKAVALSIHPSTFAIVRKDMSVSIAPVAEVPRVVLTEAEILEIGGVVFQDELVTIKSVSLKSSEGFLLNMTNFNDIHFLSALQSFKSQMDEDDEMEISFDLPRVWEMRLGNRSMLYVESDGTDMIMSRYNGSITPHTAGILQDILGAMHKMHICAGLFVDISEDQTDLMADLDYLRGRFLDFFAISKNGNSIDFVNFSKIRICSEDEAAAEMGTFIDAFDDELFPDEADEDD